MASDLTVSMGLSTMTAADFCQSLGAEIMIVLVTLSCGFLMQRAAPFHHLAMWAAKKLRSPRQKTAKSDHSPCSPPLSRKSVRVVCQTPLARQPQQLIRSSAGAVQCCEWRSASVAKSRGHNEDLIDIINEIVRVSRGEPGPRSAAVSLELYGELQRRRAGRTIEELARRSNTSAINFFVVLVQAAVWTGKYRVVEEIIDDMKRQDFARPRFFYEDAIKLLAGQKQNDMALRLHDRLVEDGHEPSAGTLSRLVSLAADLGEFRRAVEFFDTLAATTTPPIRSYMTVLRVHAKLMDWPSSLAVLRDMQRRAAFIDCLLLNIVLSTGVAAGEVKSAEVLVTEVEVLGSPVLDVVSYNTLLKGYAQRGDVTKALRTMARMRARGLVPNAITFNTAMDAAVRNSSMCAVAWELLEEMMAAGLRPDKFTCSILVKGLSKRNRSATSKIRIDSCLAALSEAHATFYPHQRRKLYGDVLESAEHLGDSECLRKVLEQMSKLGVESGAGSTRSPHGGRGGRRVSMN